MAFSVGDNGGFDLSNFAQQNANYLNPWPMPPIPPNFAATYTTLDTNFRVGDIVRLKDYTTYPDYLQHRKQDAQVIGFDHVRHNPVELMWGDGTRSRVHPSNLIAMADNASGRPVKPPEKRLTLDIKKLEPLVLDEA